MTNLERILHEKDIKQKEVAVSLGVSAPTVSDWVNGKKNPAGKNLIKLSNLLECTTDYILGVESEDASDNEFIWLDDLSADEIADKCYEDFRILFSRSNKVTHEQMKGFYIDTYKRFNTRQQ